jgi:hypothetical protein
MTNMHDSKLAPCAMTRLVALASALVSSAFLSGCATTQVKTQRGDQAAPLASYQSFKVDGGEVVKHGEVESSASIANDAVEIALHDTLTMKGLDPDAARPDLLVRYKASAEYVFITDVDYVPNEIWTNEGRPNRYVQNTLVIDLIDPVTDERVWRSVATAENARFDKLEQVAEIVEAALAKYPGT